MIPTQHSFTNSCLHPAYGPVLSSTIIYLPLTTHHTPSRSSPALQKIHLRLSIPCPFCADPNLHAFVPAGSGVLVILASSSSSSSTFPSYADTWEVLRVCHVEGIRSGEWDLGFGMGMGMGWTQMAWVPRPVGDVLVSGSGEGEGDERMDGVGGTVEIRQRWRAGMGESKEGFGWRGRVESRLPGMMARLGAVVGRGRWR